MGFFMGVVKPTLSGVARTRLPVFGFGPAGALFLAVGSLMTEMCAAPFAGPGVADWDLGVSELRPSASDNGVLDAFNAETNE
jgi:hypothetical protein